MKDHSDEDGHLMHRRVANFPGLAGLRINDSDLAALAIQGHVTREQCRALEVFKLRFRRQRQQVVRYIGDRERARIIRDELDRLQFERRLQLELGRIAKQAAQMLRKGKRCLEPIMMTSGFRFHGHALRRTRKRIRTN
jgi:hypothetical protein